MHIVVSVYTHDTGGNVCSLTLSLKEINIHPIHSIATHNVCIICTFTIINILLYIAVYENMVDT